MPPSRVGRANDWRASSPKVSPRPKVSYTQMHFLTSRIPSSRITTNVVKQISSHAPNVDITWIKNVVKTSTFSSCATYNSCKRVTLHNYNYNSKATDLTTSYVWFVLYVDCESERPVTDVFRFDNLGREHRHLAIDTATFRVTFLVDLEGGYVRAINARATLLFVEDVPTLYCRHRWP